MASTIDIMIAHWELQYERLMDKINRGDPAKEFSTFLSGKKLAYDEMLAYLRREKRDECR